jgi:multidrug transporter EmrE-like cation transporter
MVFGFPIGEMNVRVYHVIVAYGFLCVSVLTFAISLLISALALIDGIFRVGFGYPLWSAAVGVALAVLGFALIKASLGYLKMVKRKEV